MECALCNAFVETMDHLFLQCSWSWSIWIHCMNWWGIGVQDAITAKILAITKACELCISQMELASRIIVINSDSKVAVSWINNEDLGNINIRNNLLRLGQTTVEFSSRSMNSLADSLAKKGSTGDEDVIAWNLS
ncbi:hypothetical protein Ddye_023012 [Dipteronia dyeriana]|uniref:Uncharacterized protein n=1 Tax=Dipteronia dyeriana TaxID=168575 RepID=A0AAD9WRQ8_9ROSI|nr:hypothetical protein Ddye_023012 [Dipteronia dyeriana]